LLDSGLRFDRDSPADLRLSDPGLDGSAGPADRAPDQDPDGPPFAAAHCKAWELAGPAKTLSKFPVPSVRVGNRYAVLSTVSSRVDRFDTEIAHYAHSVELSWFDPQTGIRSDPVMPFRFQGYNDAGAMIDFGTANPAAIAATPQGFAIVWTATRQSKTSLHFALIDGSGHALSQPLMLEAQVDRVGDVVWDGSQTVVLWNASTGPLRLGRIDDQGNLLGTTELSDRTYLGPLRLFWDGSAYGVFWENSLPNLDEVWFARVGQDGSLMVPKVQLTGPDCYAGLLQVEWFEDEYIVYWRDNPRTAACVPQTGLRRLDRTGQAQGTTQPLDPRLCQVSLMATSDRGLGFVCANGNGVGFAGFGDGESGSLMPVLPVGLPAPTTGGIQVASARALFGSAEGFDVFWSGSLDGSSWNTYFSRIRCAE
jgi:hypothetical protein